MAPAQRTPWAAPAVAAALLLLALAACGGPVARPSPSPAPTPVPFSVPTQPFVEDCSPAGCQLEGTAPYSFQLPSTELPSLPATLPVARYDPLTAASALALASRLLGPGWQLDGTPPDVPATDTSIVFHLIRGGERLWLTGRTMSGEYTSASQPCQQARPDRAITASRAWLKARGLVTTGLSASATTAGGCGAATVTWEAPAFTAAALRQASIDVSGTTVTHAVFALPAIAIRSLPYLPPSRALGIAVTLGAGPPAEASAAVTMLTELGNDGAWYSVPAVSVTAANPPGEPGRTITAYAPLS